ncbi:hypothetical protein [Endozoicomonas atrinae]|uniref:hypothetical protein n=1 Tax=Endozoicomonas atrinae TaxID=1333660 RepID=UPI003B006F0A
MIFPCQSWQGLRFEIHVLASLIQKEINFNKQESPDFSIKFKQHNLYVEATSARLEKSKGLSHYKKIEYAISEKNSKPYANKNTALFIDITNIIFNESKIEEKGDFEQLVSSIHENDSNNYGSVILFTFRMNYDLGHYESVWRRVDINGCSDDLVEFLDSIYPSKEFLSVPNHFEFVHSA